MRESHDVADEQRAGSEVHLDEWVSPDATDDRGLLRAGKILEWMDVAGVLAAARHCRSAVVTASIDGTELREPVRLGAHVAMTARVAYTSARSIGVSVSLAHREAGGSAQRPCVEAYMTFVAPDAGGQAMAIPQFMPQTASEQARFDEGKLRREFRRKLAAGEIPIRADDDPLSGLAEEHRPAFVRELLKFLPRTLRMPWERRDPLQPRARHRSYMHKIEPVRAGKLNFHGTLYGGTLMRWIETTAALSARAHVEGAAMRLAGLHGLNFIRPASRDRFVHIRSVVVHTAGDSLTVLVNVQSEDPLAGTFQETLRAFLTYVPIDASVRISPIECVSDEERTLHAEVAQRLALQRSLSGRLERAA